MPEGINSINSRILLKHIIENTESAKNLFEKINKNFEIYFEGYKEDITEIKNIINLNNENLNSIIEEKNNILKNEIEVKLKENNEFYEEKQNSLFEEIENANINNNNNYQKLELKNKSTNKLMIFLFFINLIFLLLISYKMFII